MPTIQLNNVKKAFHSTNGHSDRMALHPTTLTFESGKIVTILGGSGSGKTTLLKLINRLHKPDGGEILLDGQDTADIPENTLRLGMGYVIQQTGLFTHMTVGENIAIVPKMLRWPKEKTSARIDELMHLVGLDPVEYRERYPRQLSGGQQQRVGLARALAGDPPILLMDEPFGALDPIVRQHLQDELLTLQIQLQKTIIFVTHDVQEALKLGDRIIVMQDGHVRQHATPDDIVNNPADDFVASLVDSGTPSGSFALKGNQFKQKVTEKAPAPAFCQQRAPHQSLISVISRRQPNPQAAAIHNSRRLYTSLQTCRPLWITGYGFLSPSLFRQSGLEQTCQWLFGKSLLHAWNYSWIKRYWQPKRQLQPAPCVISYNAAGHS